MTAPLDPVIDAKVRASFGAQAMMTTLGARLESLAQGAVTISAEVTAALTQQQGFSHAGLIFSIGDSAAGYSALTMMPEEAEVMTVEMKINLLSPGAGRLVAEGRVIRPGKRLVVVAADVWADDPSDRRRHVAMLQGTMIPVDRG
ncbi:PaaI family thioesterase [Loktanella sp. IMCC34160]|uniref:PaaI family thioesterase n=1 Tax=Loktanella sp. IMCC34160 TaxID=2510646 RepID=UPI001A91DE63|nr:PaaI family thioesterase [Loktanella sp. IMCC34160]